MRRVAGALLNRFASLKTAGAVLADATSVEWSLAIQLAVTSRRTSAAFGRFGGGS